MSQVDAGPLASYNSLMDPNLSGYFTNKRKTKHLRKMGLITRRGEIVSESTFRLNMARKEHQKHVRDLLAQAIVHKTLDMERGRQVQIKQKLEEIAKIELVRRIKSERGRKGDEDVLPFLTPRKSQSRPTSSRKLQDDSRPKSAPSPKRQPLYVDEDGFPVNPKDVSPESKGSRKKSPYPTDDLDDRHLYSLDQRALIEYTKAMRAADSGRSGPSPYVMMDGGPVPTPPPRGSPRSSVKNRVKVHPTNGRGKEVKCPSAYHTGTLMLHRVEPAMKHQERVQTLCEITMHYFGSNLKLDYERFDPREEVIVEQQHCGGNTLYVFKEPILPHSDFTFTSRRHRGYPFSMTFYINGVLDCRLSTCCEYKHQKGARVGGKTGRFAIVSIKGAAPCYRCQVNEQMKAKEKRKEAKRKSKKEKEQKNEEYEDDYEDDNEEEEEEDDEKNDEDAVEIKGEGDGIESAKDDDQYSDDFDGQKDDDQSSERGSKRTSRSSRSSSSSSRSSRSGSSSSRSRSPNDESPRTNSPTPRTDKSHDKRCCVL